MFCRHSADDLQIICRSSVDCLQICYRCASRSVADYKEICLFRTGTFLHSINATRKSNENGRFSAWLGLFKLMLQHKIEIVVFLGNTEIFEERKHMVFFTVASKGHQQIEHNFLQV